MTFAQAHDYNDYEFFDRSILSLSARSCWGFLGTLLQSATMATSWIVVCGFVSLICHSSSVSSAGFSVSLSKTYAECSSSSYPSPCVGEPGFSGEYAVEGSGILTYELKETILTPIPPMGGRSNWPWAFEYKTATGQWEGVGWDLFRNFTGSRVLLEETETGNYGSSGQPYVRTWKYRVTNGKSPLGRLGVWPRRIYEGYGFYQINSTVTHKLKFEPRDDNQSTLSGHLDQAGGANDNKQTVFIPRPPCPVRGLPQYSVNTALLNLVIEDMEFGCQSQGLDESMRRVWNMRPGITRMFGNGWSFAFESTLLAQPYMSGGSGDVTLRLGSGQETEYRVSGTEPDGPNMTTVHYIRTTAGLGPILSASIGIGTDTGFYTLIDKTAKLTYAYEIADYQLHNGAYLYQLASVTDRNNNEIDLDYDAAGRLVSLTDSSGRRTEFSYGADNLVSLMKTFDGRSASYQYDTRGNLTQNIDLLGNTITYTYDDQNYPLTMTVAGKTTSFAYASNAHGDRYVSAVTEPDGKVRNYAFVNQSDTTTIISEPVAGYTYYSNANGRTSAINNPLNQWHRVDYNAQRLPSKVTDALGHATAMEYDANGNLTKLTDPAGKSTLFTYDDHWNLIGVTDALGQKTTFAYDSHDNLISETSPLGRVTAYTVDGKGQVTRIRQPDGSQYGLTYDTHGNLTGITDPLGHTTQFAFDAQGLNLASTTDALGHRTGYRFDANRRLTAIDLPDGTQWQANYDCCSLTSTTDTAGRTTTFQRDAVYRLTGITDPLSRVLSFSYNADGDLTTTTDPLGRATQTGYDKLHRTLSLTDPLGGKILLGRDAAGNPTSLTDERGKVTTMAYDSRDNLASVKDPLGKTTASYTRDALGRIQSILNARGDTITLSYDADGRLTGKSYNLNPATATTYTWGLNDELTSVQNAHGTKTFGHDAAGQVTRIGYPDGKAIATSYDAAGNIVSLTYTDGLVVNYTYDALNRVSGVSFAGNTLNLGYDAAGNLVNETRSNGTQTTYGYDAAGQLIRIGHQRGAAVIADLNYPRNSAGLITQENGTWPLNPAQMADDTTATHNDANAIVTLNSDSFTHDADGNLTGISGSRRFGGTYDPENRLTNVTWNDGATTAYVYDGLGYRVQTQTANGTSTLYHDSAGRLLDRIAPSQALTHYIYADDRLIASGSAAQGYVFYHFDKTGNTLALTDAAGQVVGAYAYDSFGKVVAHTGLTTPFTYVGAYGVIGVSDNLFFMQNRFYDANTGRFIQRDPIGFAGGQSNLYSYVGNNPISSIDPSGKAWQVIVIGVTGSAWLIWDYVVAPGRIVILDRDFVEGPKTAGAQGGRIYIGRKFFEQTKTLQAATLVHEMKHINQNYKPGMWGNYLDAELEALSDEADYIIGQIKANRNCDWTAEKARLKTILRDMQPDINPNGQIKWPILNAHYKNYLHWVN